LGLNFNYLENRNHFTTKFGLINWVGKGRKGFIGDKVKLFKGGR